MADFGRRVWRRSRHARGEGWKRVRACGHTYDSLLFYVRTVQVGLEGCLQFGG